MRYLSIAMDGPVGAGKSTIADAVAARLHILHLDTGAMYRACGLSCLRAAVPPDDEAAVVSHIAGITVEAAFSEQGQRTLLNGEDVSGLIRTEEVSMAASKISGYAAVRRQMVALQQAMAATRSMLVDGRDICRVVLPDAQVKIFLTASPEERARRRYEQLLAKGAQADYAQVLADLKQRDARDMGRAVDPLCPTEDAVIIDSTGRSFEETVEEILALVRRVYHE